MTWTIDSFPMGSDSLQATFNLDPMAVSAVERLIGSRPDVLEPGRIRSIAPLFDVDASQWESVAGPLVDVDFLGRGWMD